jgi:hypothetical protein
MRCPECKTEMRRDPKKYMGVIFNLEEKTFALYYCPNPQCSRWELPVCKNIETDEPYKGPFLDENIEMIETTYQ